MVRGLGGTSDRRWLIADERGSIVAVTNGAGGASGAGFGINTYDEYGAPGPSNLGRFQYTGQAWLPEAGLYHYKARAYSPSLGRFLQTDPIGFAGGMNLYAYVGNDPVNATDPSGLQTDTIVVIGQNCGGSQCYFGNDIGDFLRRGNILGGDYYNAADRYAQHEREERAEERAEEAEEACSSAAAPMGLAGQLGALGLGIGDAFTFGLYSRAFRALPGTWGALYDRESQQGGYDVGFWGATGVSAGRLAYAGSASLFRHLPGPQAVEARNALKGAMSGLGGAHPRIYTYEQMLSRYGSDRAVREAASRTNPTLNAAAGIGAVSSATQATQDNDQTC